LNSLFSLILLRKLRNKYSTLRDSDNVTDSASLTKVSLDFNEDFISRVFEKKPPFSIEELTVLYDNLAVVQRSVLSKQ